MRVIVCLAALLSSSAASAAVYMETTHSQPGEQDAPSVQKMWFDGGRMRAEGDGRTVTLFKDETVYILDAEDKTYTVMDKATLDKLGGQVARMRKQMEAQMAGMPPEQREMMEKMMSQMGGGTQAPPKRSVTATARTDTAAGQKCKIWEVVVEGAREQELCVVAPEALPGGTEMMRTMRSLGEMFKGFADSLGGTGRDAVSEAWRDLQTVNGIPIITRQYEAGAVTDEMEVTAIRNDSLPAGAFDIPPGYQPRKMEFGR